MKEGKNKKTTRSAPLLPVTEKNTKEANTSGGRLGISQVKKQRT